MKIDKRATRKAIKKALDEGKTKDQIFDEIFALYGDNSLQGEIAGLVRYVPERWRIKKYGIWNYLLLILLSGIDIYVIITINLSSLILFGLLTWIVATFKTKYYSWFIFMGAVTIIFTIAASLFGYIDEEQNLLRFFGGFGLLSLVFILFGIYMPDYLTPAYRIVEESTPDAEGKEQKRKRIHFD